MLEDMDRRSIREPQMGHLLPAAISDIGCEREINEDRYACFKSGNHSVWVVCDGMGGAVGGELAAQLAVDTIRRVLEAGTGGFSHDLVAYAFQEANRVIVLRRQNPAFQSMGTTIVGALIGETSVSFYHAGDSRAYLISDTSISQLTDDHTYVQDLVTRGTISHEEAMNHPQSHVLTRCLGGQLKIELDPISYRLNKSDESSHKLLLCSDGLYSLLGDNEIHSIANSTSPQNACAEMVEIARKRGGFDNITLAIIPLAGYLDVSAPFKEEVIEAPKQVAKVMTHGYGGRKKKSTASSLKKWGILLSLAFVATLSVSYLVLMLLGN